MGCRGCVGPISKYRFVKGVNKDVFKSLGILPLVRRGVQEILEMDEVRWDAVARAINEAAKSGVDCTVCRRPHDGGRWQTGVWGMSRGGVRGRERQVRWRELVCMME